ncbi:MAG TPA: hypothetical protein VK735_39835 [Pseudonocardia sp.]|uniref:hypothetical protein n=1 Tax=Pseudonocardia sp. TaxID=60912 RepID=UPI002BCFD32A|nr:hypothetical protein [Pseudonocardia sp.]HTF53635.1 hypothetical protein [Pseudonocardia sp.]
MTIRHYNREGDPISLVELGRLYEDLDYRRVVFTKVGPYEVSTAWLGTDHRYGDGPPLIFETMVFEPPRDRYIALINKVIADHPEFEEFTTRHSTEDEARREHELIVETLRQAVALFDDEELKAMGQQPPDDKKE